MVFLLLIIIKYTILQLTKIIPKNVTYMINK